MTTCAWPTTTTSEWQQPTCHERTTMTETPTPEPTTPEPIEDDGPSPDDGDGGHEDAE